MPRRPALRTTRIVFGVLGALMITGGFLALADPPSPWGPWLAMIVGGVWMWAAIWAPDRWVERVAGLFTGWP